MKFTYSSKKKKILFFTFLLYIKILFFNCLFNCLLSLIFQILFTLLIVVALVVFVFWFVLFSLFSFQILFSCLRLLALVPRHRRLAHPVQLLHRRQHAPLQPGASPFAQHRTPDQCEPPLSVVKDDLLRQVHFV
jgi:hypothetical protein